MLYLFIDLLYNLSNNINIYVKKENNYTKHYGIVKMCIKKTISENIKLLMGQSNIKAWSELSRLCGLTVPAMQRLINQGTESPGVKSLKSIADFFKITVDDLISSDKIMGKGLGTSSTTENHVPLFDDVSINKWLRLQNTIEIKKSDNTISTDVPISKNAFAYRVLDGNLSPTIPQNSILIIDTERKLQNRNYALLKYPGFENIIIRQVLTDGMDKYTIPIISGYNNTPHEKLSPEVVIVGIVVKISIYFR
jgi:transcriptional regulator with XRE-family HTH domain